MAHQDSGYANEANPKEYQIQKLYIKKLDEADRPESLENDLKEYFSAFGSVIDVKTLRNSKKELYAFVTFQEEESVVEVLNANHRFRGRSISLSRAKDQTKNKKPEKFIEDARKIFVGGIPNQVTLEEFRQYFTQFGDIVDILLPLKSRRSKINSGYGFVTFRDPRSAKAVINNNKKHILRAKWIDVKIANPRNSTSPNAKAFQDHEDDDEHERKDFFTLLPTEKNGHSQERDQDGSHSTSLQKTAPVKALPKGKKPGDSAGISESRQNPNVFGINSSLKSFEAQFSDYVNSQANSYAQFPESQDQLKRSSEDF